MHRKDDGIYEDYPHEYDAMDEVANSRALTAETPVLVSLIEQAVNFSDHQYVNTSYDLTPLFQHIEYESIDL